MLDATIGGALIAGLTGLLGWLIGRQQLKRADEQIRLGTASFASDWFRDLRSWANEAIEVLSEASYCCVGANGNVDSTSTIAVKCRHKLSALIDRGRFFLPNDAHEDYGTHKPAAYRGIRQSALDYLVEAEQVLAGHKRAELAIFGRNSEEVLVNLRREFVSSVHDILDPRERNKELKALLASASVPREQRKLQLPAS